MPNQSDLENIDLIAPLYDLDFVAFPREDLEFYQWLSETHGKNILELGVGTGRIGVGLAETGATVTGIDLSEKMIAEATKLAEKQNVEIELIVSDMTDFALSRRISHHPDGFCTILTDFAPSRHILHHPDGFCTSPVDLPKP